MSANVCQLKQASQAIIIPHPRDKTSLTFDSIFLAPATSLQAMRHGLPSTIGEEITIQERTFVVLWSAMYDSEYQSFFVGLVEKVEGIKSRILLAKETIEADPELKALQDAFAANAKQATENYLTGTTPKKIPPRLGGLGIPFIRPGG